MSPSSISLARLPRSQRRAQWLLFALSFACASCRIRRELRQASADAGAASASAPEQQARGERGRGLDKQSSEALSLWVLNRPEAELVPRDEPPAAAPAPQPSSQLLIALDSADGEGCARALAEAGLAQLEQGQSAQRVLLQALADAGRFRWGRAAREARFHIALRGSDGPAVGVLSTPLVPFPEQALAAARRYGGVVAARQRPAPATEPDAGVSALPAACSESPVDPEPGAVAVLVVSSGRFEASLIQLQADSDAGLLGYAAQPGTALATGPAGALSVIGDCSSLPEDFGAGPLYETLASGRRPARIDASACRRGYAWLTANGGEVATAAPSAWALVSTRAPAPRETELTPPRTERLPEAAPDAGHSHGRFP